MEKGEKLNEKEKNVPRKNMTRNIDATKMRITTDIAFVSRGITLKNTRKRVV